MDFDKIKKYIQSIPNRLKEKFIENNKKTSNSKNDDLKKIESELSKIYFDIMNSDEISIYKKELINQKVMLLNLKLESMNIDSKSDNMIDLDKEIKKDRIILTILTILLIFFPPLGVIVLAGYSLYTVIHITKLLNLSNSKENKYTGMEEQLRSMINTLHNCGVFLTKKHNIWLENQNKDLDDNITQDLEVRIANDLLQEFLNSGYFRAVPTNVENYLIKMLQDDLETEEQDLQQLMNLAKEKISLENLSEELNLGVNSSRKVQK